ncbi:unnamed protein product, partial [Meganyctiphanes norvegica]
NEFGNVKPGGGEIVTGTRSNKPGVGKRPGVGKGQKPPNRNIGDESDFPTRPNKPGSGKGKNPESDFDNEGVDYGLFGTRSSGGRNEEPGYVPDNAMPERGEGGRRFNFPTNNNGQGFNFPGNGNGNGLGFPSNGQGFNFPGNGNALGFPGNGQGFNFPSGGGDGQGLGFGNGGKTGQGFQFPEGLNSGSNQGRRRNWPNSPDGRFPNIHANQAIKPRAGKLQRDREHLAKDNSKSNVILRNHYKVTQEDKIIIGGEVEIQVKNSDGSVKKGSVCHDDWGTEEATVVCNVLAKRMNYEIEAAASSAPSPTPNHPPLPIKLTEVDCKGSEQDLLNCAHDSWGKSDCSTAQVAGVKCVLKHRNIIKK